MWRALACHLLAGELDISSDLNKHHVVPVLLILTCIPRMAVLSRYLTDKAWYTVLITESRIGIPSA